MGEWLHANVPALVQPLAKRKLETGRWRRLGLWRDDLISDENDVTQEALSRIPKPHLHARFQRSKVALHYSMLRRELPEDKWVKSADDQPYLLPFVNQVLAEHAEREKYDNGVFERAKNH